MAIVIRRPVRVANPASPSRRRKQNPRRKLTAAQIAAGFGGKRRQSAALASRRRVRRNSTSKPAGNRRPTVRRKQQNIGEIVVLGNPAPVKERKTVAKRRTSKKAAVRRRSRKNPSTKRRAVFMAAPRKRRNFGRRHHRRNPGVRGVGSMLTKAGWVVGGLVGARAVTQLAFSLAKQPSANSGVIGYISNIIASFALGAAVGKFKSVEAGQQVTIGGLAGVVARAVAEYSPIGSFVKSQLSGLGDYGLGIYLPGQFGPPWVPVDPQTVAGGVQMLNPFPAPPALPAPRSGSGVGRLGDVGSGVGGRYGSAGRYN